MMTISRMLTQSHSLCKCHTGIRARFQRTCERDPFAHISGEPTRLVSGGILGLMTKSGLLLFLRGLCQVLKGLTLANHST
jgi:hypothetical protein